MKQIKLKVVTPEKLVLEELVDEVVLPTTEGEISILPNHVPLIAKLQAGDIVGKLKEENIPMAVVGGFVEVNKDGDKMTTVVVLADFAEHVSELTENVIEEAKKRAEELKEKIDKEDVDFEHFQTELERALTRIKIASKWRKRKYRR